MHAPGRLGVGAGLGAACVLALGTTWYLHEAVARAAGARLTVAPRVSLLDAALGVRVTGLAPRERVTVTASQRAGANSSTGGQFWSSRAVFRADAHGTVDPARLPSLVGTYRGRHPMGLFWSMRPRGAHGPNPRVHLEPLDVSRVRVTVARRGRSLATISITRRVSLSGLSLRRTTLASEGFVGRFYTRPGGGRRTAILLLGGSEGGLPDTLAATLLASHGYPTLALAYFGVRGLPGQLKGIPLEYFERALRWLGEQQGGGRKRVAVFGVSRGAEAALLLGATYPQLVDAVVAYDPSSVVIPSLDGVSDAWLLGGRPVPHVSIVELVNDHGLGDTRAAIRVEDISGPVFLVSGTSDRIWPSAAYARAIVARLRVHKRSGFTSLVYRGAGHGVGRAVPNLPRATILRSARFGTVELGGSPTADALARSDSWPKLLRFLRRLEPGGSG